ncbi:hypothetical protein P153DRAFT_376766 [Dothidotthia symphoricarpi CBS 119687]|uniref:25S rRNA (uridine-N(3))-methyltransferase BMT5-like domain-containing protein n=1 Tax=Dothidotthia symphoricarpi CBS 119687 TaxID=1392245 RepID=A0A6A6AD40_9PLEO|nr:uncharacterized protein P153DRAFT_376766 [Dothidotthia symphoricarpi CBS 119687]KAF2128661.1 hypothetical protein P153DRAFT_376766 [Dothidotthia symphoricarpi CBS 119687]
MSKTKTKRARRELKRDGNRKIAAFHRKAAKDAPVPASTLKPGAKKQKMNTPDAKPQPAPKPPVQASQKHEPPFSEYDHILLVGEGDFSFARSLVHEHGCANVTATSLDSEEEVQQKYPNFKVIHAELSALAPPVPLHHGIDATKLSTYKPLRCERDDEDGEQGWDTICFQFPHTGGLSTDVNRQVRANQALLVDFFKSCLEITDPKKRLQIRQAQRNKNLVQKRIPCYLKMGGRIVVTLFEGEPYTLWNVRDLARHAGLKVVESSRFDWDMYPGYKHVRTLGTIEGGGAWKGEDRDARMYVFEKIPLQPDTDEEREIQKRKKEGGKKQPFKSNKRVRDADSDGDER